MTSSTLNSTTFTLYQGATQVSGTVTYVGVALVFTPAGNLAPDTEYTATITTGAKDLAGNPLASNFVWKWTTGALPDTTPPTVSSTVPVNGALDRAINSALTATFSEFMNPLTVTNNTFTLKQGANPITGTVAYAGVTATFTPTVNLASSMSYTATISTGVTDVAGNGLAVAKVWTFSTTGSGGGGGGGTDTISPTVSSTTPLNLAVGVAINSAMTATFSEAMAPLTVTNVSFNLKQGVTPVSGSVIYAGVTATFTPDAALASTTVYTATITTSVKDLAGNGLAANKVWTFTTAAAADVAAPTVSSTVPANLAVGVAINSAMTATFSEAMAPLTVTNVSFNLKQGVTPVSGSVLYAGVTATFTPDVALAASTVYTATITTGVTDVAGNPLAANKVWTFTTAAAADVTAPTVSSTVPANLAVGVAINSAMTATFSEAMAPLTVTNVSFNLKQGVTPVSGSVLYAGVTATFTPDVALASTSVYTATITTGVTDVAGNPLAANKVWTFTTAAAADVAAPTVSSTAPANLAVGVATNGAMTATFSEAMAPLTVTNVTFNLKQGVTPVSGSVLYAGMTATFTPDVALASTTVYTATITTGVTDVAGNPLAANKVWTFTTAALNPTAPTLGEAGRFVIMAAQTITTTSGSLISDGDMAIISQARSYYAGFTVGANPGQFTELVNGLSYGTDDANPAPYPYPLHYSTPVIGAPWTTTGAMITQADADMRIAYTFLAADPNPTAPTQVCPTQLGGLTLTRGVYKTGSDVLLTTGPLHLDAQGDPNAVWIFTIDGNLTFGAPAGAIILDNGAQAKNIYWRTGGKTTIEAGITVYGNIFAWTQINLLANAIVTGRLFAVTDQVTLISNTVTKAP